MKLIYDNFLGCVIDNSSLKCLCDTVPRSLLRCSVIDKNEDCLTCMSCLSHFHTPKGERQTINAAIYPWKPGYYKY